MKRGDWMRRVSIAVALVLAAFAMGATGAQAAPVTIGSSLSNFPFQFLGCSTLFPSCTIYQSALPGATLTSPVDGTVVRWRMLGASVGHIYKLRVLAPLGGLEFSSMQSGALVSPASTGVETFTTALPIKTGQRVGLDMDAMASVGVKSTPGARVNTFLPALVDGATKTATPGVSDFEVGFNAVIQPAPRITAFSPTAGPAAGGSSVVISGSDFEGATAVKFGGTAATRFTVDSESQITAVAPSMPVGQVPISVTTAAGTATSTGTYEVTAVQKKIEDPPPVAETCTVPRLRGKKLKTARKSLGKAHCKVGKVRRKRGSTRRAKVVKQSPRPGKLLPAGAKVNLTLGG